MPKCHNRILFHNADILWAALHHDYRGCVNFLPKECSSWVAKIFKTYFVINIWTNAGILLIRPLGTNFSEILIKIHTFSFKKMHLKMSSAKWRPFCLGFSELNKRQFQVWSSSPRPNQDKVVGVPHHDDVIKWKHFPRYRPFVRGIQRSPVNSPHKGQWRRALVFSMICARINGWVNNGEAGDLRRNRAHYDVTVMFQYETFDQILVTIPNSINTTKETSVPKNKSSFQEL